MYFIKRLSKINLYFQVFFWLFYGTVGLIFTYFYEGSQGAVSLGVFIVNLVLHIAMVNFHLQYLVPTYFSKHRYLSYTACTVLLLLVTSLLKSAIFMLTHTPPQMGRMEVFGALPSVAFITTVLTFIITLPFLFIDSLIEKETLRERMRAEQLEAELRILRSQINPHFLFNTLNNIYALIETGNKAAGKVVLQLSDLMHHLISVSTENMVSIEEELKCLMAYVNLHLLSHSDQSRVDISVDIRNKDIQLPALLLITLMENAFKHSDWNEESGKGYIQCQLETGADGLQFSMVNSLSQKTANSSRKAIGLENITHRMRLLFPNQHEFRASRNGNRFVTELKIFSNPALAKSA